MTAAEGAEHTKKSAEKGTAEPTRDAAGRTDRLSLALLLGSIALLLLVGASGESVAAPPLGEDGWVPPAIPWQPGPWLVVGLQWLGYLLGAASLLRHLRRPSPLRLRAWHLTALVVLILITAPTGTADHTNYAAYGRMLVEGLDPWVTTPDQLAAAGDRVGMLVQPPWEGTPSVYGPVGTWAMGLAALLGGEVMRQIVWVWQVIIVLAWLGVRMLLLRLGGPREQVDRWWTTNVLVLGGGVLGAHLDLLAIAGMLAALALALAGRPLLAGLLAGVAASTKITAGVVVLALVLGWLAGRPEQEQGLAAWRARLREHAGAIGRLALGTALVVVPLHLLASPAAVGQVAGSGGGVSYATPWRAVYTSLDTAMSEPLARDLTVGLAAVGCVVLAVLLWQITGELGRWPVLRALLVLTTAYSLGTAYVLPWYELMQWAGVALAIGLLCVAGRDESSDGGNDGSSDGSSDGGSDGSGGLLRVLLLALVARGLVLAHAYVPGRVVIPDDLATVTLGFRFVASPLAAIAVWWVIVVLWRRVRSERLKVAGG